MQMMWPNISSVDLLPEPWDWRSASSLMIISALFVFVCLFVCLFVWLIDRMEASIENEADNGAGIDCKWPTFVDPSDEKEAEEEEEEEGGKGVAHWPLADRRSDIGMRRVALIPAAATAALPGQDEFIAIWQR